MAAAPSTTQQKVADVLHHGPIKQLFANVWVVTGTAIMGPLQLPRNMVIVRHDDELTLISAVRMNDAGLAELDKLGRVRNVLKLGKFHQMDDAFYVNKYGARYWVAAEVDADTLNGVAVDVTITPETALPFPNSRFHPLAFKEPEAVVVMDDHQLLITCDSIQNWEDTCGCNMVGSFMTRALGFVDRPCNIGPGIVTANKRPDDYTGPTLWDAFQMVDKLKWANMVSAHGAPVIDGTAHAKFKATLKAWGPEKLNCKHDPMAVSFGKLRTKIITGALLLVAVAGAGLYYYMYAK